MPPRPISQSRYAFGVCAVVSAICVAGLSMLGIVPDAPPTGRAVDAREPLGLGMGLAVLGAGWSWLLIHGQARRLRLAGYALLAAV
ncbi:hypothetical protein ACIKTA_19275, partial [Hansschlegelia beijingensis]